jgi:hypothetical protein
MMYILRSFLKSVRVSMMSCPVGEWRGCLSALRASLRLFHVGPVSKEMRRHDAHGFLKIEAGYCFGIGDR